MFLAIRLLVEGDFEMVLGFVGDAALALGTEAFSVILFCGIDDTSTVDLFSLLSILSTEGDFVMVFGLDGSTTVALGTEALSSILIWTDPGRVPIEYLNSFLSVLSRKGDLVMILGLVGESTLLFAIDISFFFWFCDTERPALVFLVSSLSQEGDFESLGFGGCILVGDKSKQFGLPLVFKSCMPVGATTTLEVGLRLFVAAMLVWVIKGSSLQFIPSLLSTEASLFLEPVKRGSTFGCGGDFVTVGVSKWQD